MKDTTGTEDMAGMEGMMTEVEGTTGAEDMTRTEKKVVTTKVSIRHEGERV
jgi:hypothetical protein